MILAPPRLDQSSGSQLLWMVEVTFGDTAPEEAVANPEGYLNGEESGTDSTKAQPRW